MTSNELRKYYTGIDLRDLFGLGRMKELVYDYRLQLAKDQEEIETWRTAYLEQSKAIAMLLDMKTEPLRAILEENERLKRELEKARDNEEAYTECIEALERKLDEQEDIKKTLRRMVS